MVPRVQTGDVSGGERMTPAENHRRGDLIERRIAGTITDEERQELKRLQAVADDHVRDGLRRDLEWAKAAGDIAWLTGTGRHGK